MTRIRLALLPLLALMSWAAPAPATAQETTFELPYLSTLTDEQRDALHNEIRTYILQNPEIVMEAIGILQQRRQEAERFAEVNLVKRHRDALFFSPHDWVGGNPDGSITLVEFSDYRCPYCKRAHPVVKEFLERAPDVRLVIKEYPILGPDSVTAGRMAMAAVDVNRELYPALNDALMAYRGNLTETAAYRIAGDVGYDIGELRAKANSEEIEARLQETYALAQALNVTGTPGFVLENQVMRGFLPLEDMLARLEEARAAAN
ncbi:MAG: DsbA family protein [Pseudomonadota bacterium]